MVQPPQPSPSAGHPAGPPLVPASARWVPLPASARHELSLALRILQRGGNPLVRTAETLASTVNAAGTLAARRILPGRPDLEGRTQRAARAALSRAFGIAVLGFRRRIPRGRGHLARAAVTVSGALGGLYGLPGLLPDLGISTLAIMRDIARIARQHGEDLGTEPGRRACLEVFLLTPAPATEGVDIPESELSYFSARLLLRGGPLIALLEQATARYGLVLSQKLAAQAVPVVGAAIGVALNNAFLSHYRDLARAHFTIRRLERLHGESRVHEAARILADRLAESALAQDPNPARS